MLTVAHIPCLIAFPMWYMDHMPFQQHVVLKGHGTSTEFGLRNPSWHSHYLDSLGILTCAPNDTEVSICLKGLLECSSGF